MAVNRSTSRYQVLIVREPNGYSWQIRHNRHAKIAERSLTVYATHAEALATGEQALSRFKPVEDGDN